MRGNFIRVVPVVRNVEIPEHCIIVRLAVISIPDLRRSALGENHPLRDIIENILENNNIIIYSTYYGLRGPVVCRMYVIN